MHFISLDFPSGHLGAGELSPARRFVYSLVAETEFESWGVADGERYSPGEVTLEFCYMPGAHTRIAEICCCLRAP